MRRTIGWVAAAAALAAALGWLPFRAVDVRELLPVQSIAVTREEGLLCIETDNGLHGSGETWDKALTALEQAAPGTPFYGTASVVFVEQEADAAAVIACEALRPAIRLYFGRAPVALEEAADWARVHGTQQTIGNMRRQTPEVKAWNGSQDGNMRASSLQADSARRF